MLKNRVRNLIKEELNKIIESGGKQDDLYNSTEEITTTIVEFLNNYIELNKGKLLDGHTWDFSIPEIPTKDMQEKTLIGYIKTNIEYIHSGENKINGSFKRVKLMDDGFYSVFLEIRININKALTKMIANNFNFFLFE